MDALDLDLVWVGGEQFGGWVVKDGLVAKKGADVDVKMGKWGGILEAEACRR